MKKTFWTSRKKRHSIKKRLMVCAVSFIVPIIVFLMASNLYAAHLLRGQVSASNRNTVKLYAEQMNTKFTDIKNYLLSLGNNFAVEQVGVSKSYNEKILAGYRLQSEFQKGLSLYHTIVDGFFMYDPVYEIYMKEMTNVKSVAWQNEMEQKIRELTKKEEIQKQISAEWFNIQIGGKYYVVRIYHIYGIYYGSWSDVERVLDEMVTIPIEGAETVLLLDKEKVPMTSDEKYKSEEMNWEEDFSDYYLTGPEKRYVVIGESIENGTYYFVALILDQEIQKGIYLFGVCTAALICISIILLWMFIRYSKEELAIPLERTVQMIERVEEGDLDVVLSTESNTTEFYVLNDSFNKMLKEIKNLKIKVYEEKIEKQKAQLDFLQIQTNPHFFINAMNVLYNYARLDNMEMVKNMTLSLVKHFRYTLYGETWVLLEEEVEFIQNYLHIQKLKTANMSKIQIETEIPKEVLEEKIPIMTIQPFVENSIKYGESEEGEVKIWIDAEKENGVLKICVRDNGEGFDEEVLEALNKEQCVVREGKKRIGIYNVQSRLSILYGEEGAKIHFSNGEDGGAVVKIWLSKTVKIKR
ncbi:MAG: histidine kinase [Clostridiales bacterium]|nr:histidine kinase [Clostridiales bacterium]